MSQTPGVPRRASAGHVSSYGEGRVCVRAGCETLLSRYNAHQVCAEHANRERVEADELLLRRSGI